MLKTEVIEFQEIMNDLVSADGGDEKRPSYYVLNFKEKTIVPVAGLSIRALKAFGKDRYSVFIKRWKDRRDEISECPNQVTNEELLEALEKCVEEY